jgi:fucose permease
MIGAVTGEAIVPVLIGVVMDHQGVAAVLISSFIISVGLVGLYLTIFKLLVDSYPSHLEEHRQVITENGQNLRQEEDPI